MDGLKLHFVNVARVLVLGDELKDYGAFPI
jgi:hypothetical protein